MGPTRIPWAWGICLCVCVRVRIVGRDCVNYTRAREGLLHLGFTCAAPQPISCRRGGLVNCIHKYRPSAFVFVRARYPCDSVYTCTLHMAGIGRFTGMTFVDKSRAF